MSSTITKKMILPLTGKPAITFILIILGITVYYFIIYSSKTVSIQNYTPSPDVKPNQCNLSMLESDSWFCEQDSDWKRRKMIDRIQNKRNRISNNRPFFFQNNWEPTIQCEFERRIGNIGDGGKWICDIHRFQQINNTNILIYSFGSNGDFSFERATKEQLPKAEIHTFDMGLFKCPDNVCIFHQARLGNGKTSSSKSMQMIINELGHRKRDIHIMKVDIEGSEFDFFEELFNSATKNQTDSLYIRQILFEIHLGSGLHEEPSRRTHKLFELFRANNYAIFHKEANLYEPHNVFEYALLRLNSAFFLSPL